MTTGRINQVTLLCSLPQREEETFTMQLLERLPRATQFREESERFKSILHEWKTDPLAQIRKRQQAEYRKPPRSLLLQDPFAESIDFLGEPTWKESDLFSWRHPAVEVHWTQDTSKRWTDTMFMMLPSWFGAFTILEWSIYHTHKFALAPAKDSPSPAWKRRLGTNAFHSQDELNSLRLLPARYAPKAVFWSVLGMLPVRVFAQLQKFCSAQPLRYRSITVEAPRKEPHTLAQHTAPESATRCPNWRSIQGFPGIAH